MKKIEPRCIVKRTVPQYLIFVICLDLHRKYAKAKKCTKNATMALCEMTPRLQDEMEFLYDRFNPFCFNLTDPPVKTPAPRNPRNSATPKGNVSRAANEVLETNRGSLEEKQQSAPNGAQSVTSSCLCYLVVLAFISLAIQC